MPAVFRLHSSILLYQKHGCLVNSKDVFFLFLVTKNLSIHNFTFRKIIGIRYKSLSMDTGKDIRDVSEPAQLLLAKGEKHYLWLFSVDKPLLGRINE